MQEIIEEDLSPEKKDNIEENFEETLIDTLYPQPMKLNEGEFKSKEKKFILLKKIDENIPESSNKIQNLNNEQLSM